MAMCARQKHINDDDVMLSDISSRYRFYLCTMPKQESTNVQVKRRWDDDVVFKNQARTEPKKQKRFVNDTVRSDFHRRFLDRYVK